MKSLERISDVELNALVDGELIAERRAQVERWLAEEPEAAARVESWRRQNDIIRAAFARVAQDPLPADIATLLGPRPAALRCVTSAIPPAEAPIRQSHRFGAIEAGRRQRMAGFTALAFLGGGLAVLAGASVLGTLGHSAGPTTIASSSSTRSPFAFSRRALDAQAALSTRDDLLLDLASSDMREISTFLSDRMGVAIALPDPGGAYRARGVRLIPGFSGLDGYLLLESATGSSAGILVGRAESAEMPAMQIREADGRRVAWFISGGVGYGVAGTLDRADLLTLAGRLSSAIRKP
jgi:anti-sigma factor RsiW